MIKYSFILLLSFFYTCIFAQDLTGDHQKVSKAELQLTSCTFEPGASAMKLLDIQQIEFQNDGYMLKLKTERTVRIKIFNKKGYKYASVKIPYFSKKGIAKLKNLRATVYNLDESGKIITQKLEKKDFFKEQSEENLGIINFTFPNLKPGSVIEYSYSKIEKNIFRIEPWIVQDEIPVAFSQTILTIPSDSKIKEKIYGAESITTNIIKPAGNREQRIYVQENIPSFQYEPFMSSFTDNLLRVNFLLVPRTNFFLDTLTSPQVIWKYTGAHFLGSPYFGKQIQKSIPGTENLIDSAKKIASVAVRIQFIFEAVNKRIPDNVEQVLDADDIVDAWKDRNGNSTEINLILLNLLSKAGVTCYPVLVSTRSHGEINIDFPSAGQFNGMDALAIDSNKVYVMDASLKWQSYQTPPFNVLNRKGLVLIRDTVQWVVLSDPRPLVKQVVSVKTFFADTSNMKGSAETAYFDYAKTFLLDSADTENDHDLAVTKPEGLKIISKTLELATQDADPLKQKIEFSYEPQKQNDFYFIDPQFLFLRRQNPFLSSVRNTDIDFGCNQQYAFSFQLTVPSFCQVEFVPKNIILRTPDSGFVFKRISSTDSSTIYFTQSFEINRSIFDKEEYLGVQEFFKRVYGLMAEEIVLKKKK